MATRDHRLGEFEHGPPPANQPLQLLCEDHNGTYLLPFVASGATVRGTRLTRPHRLKRRWLGGVRVLIAEPKRTLPQAIRRWIDLV
jgi:hypothetical protein